MNPEWNPRKEQYVFSAEDGLDWAEYVRLEIFDARNAATAVQEERVGAIFIPIVDITSRPEEKTYRITTSKLLASYLKNSSLGEITVRIQKVQDIDTSFQRTLALSSWLQRSTIYNTYWFTKCIPAGDLDKTEDELSLSEENFVLAPLYVGLVLKDLNHLGKHNEGICINETTIQ